PECLQFISYPIISNQKSKVFTLFILYLAAEVSNTALMSTHLNFLSFYKQAGKSFMQNPPLLIKRTRSILSEEDYLLVEKVMRKKIRIFRRYNLRKDPDFIPKRRKKRIYFNWLKKKYDIYKQKNIKLIKKSKKLTLNEDDAQYVDESIMRSVMLDPENVEQNAIISNKKTYIFNKRSF